MNCLFFFIQKPVAGWLLHAFLMAGFFLKGEPDLVSGRVRPHYLPPQIFNAGHFIEFGRSRVVIWNGNQALAITLTGAKVVEPLLDKAAVNDRLASPCAQLYSTVTYLNPWPGVAVIYHGQAGMIVKSEYRLKTGFSAATIENIRIRYSCPVRLDVLGRLHIRNPAGDLMESAPLAWQEIRGRKIRVEAGFKLLNTNEVGFSIRGYDARYPLVIDPALTWNTFLGGASWDAAYGIVLDSGNNLVVVGASDAAWGDPAQAYHGGEDTFVAKMDSNGNLLWNTFVGGTGDDFGDALALDGGNNIYISGNSTLSWGSPINAFSVSQDAFAVKLDSGGNLVWNTFLGGAGNDSGWRIAADSGNRIYVVGVSDASWGAPVAAFGGGTDVFVARLDNNGNLFWNTFLGGPATDEGWAIAAPGDGTVCVGGYSSASWGSPVAVFNAGADAFVAKLDSAGALLWNTFHGNSTWGTALAVDANGFIYTCGESSSSWGTPLSPYQGGSCDAYIAKLDSQGNLLWNTFVGGPGADYGYRLSLDSTGRIGFAGMSDASWGTPWRPFGAGNDAFVALFDSGGTLLWNGFLGGAGTDVGGGIIIRGGNIFVTGRSNQTWGSPIRAYTGDYDAFAARILFETPTPTSSSTATTTRTRTSTSSATRTPTPTLTNTATPAIPLLNELSNYPNPFWPRKESTNLRYTLREDAEVEVVFFNYLGNLVFKKYCNAGEEGGRRGTNLISWDGRDSKGIVVGSGGYLCRITTQSSGGKSVFTRKIGVVWEK